MIDFKNNFFKIKNIILMYFSTKSTLKNNCNHTTKQAVSLEKNIYKNNEIYLML
jgi:hypothetical protein